MMNFSENVGLLQAIYVSGSAARNCVLRTYAGNYHLTSQHPISRDPLLTALLGVHDTSSAVQNSLAAESADCTLGLCCSRDID